MRRRNTDARIRDLERRARTGDLGALTAFAENVGRRMGDWAWVVRAVVAAGPSVTNAFMDHADFPTWNRLAPAAYAGAASWPEADLVRAQEILHERLLDRGCGSEEAGWEACAFPVFAVLIGGRVPARMVDDPDGLPRLLSYRAGDPRGAWSVCRRWQPREQITSFPEEFATTFLAVLDEERGAVACATATTQGSAGTHFGPSWVTHWSVGRGLGSRDYSPRQEQNWLEWAREIDPWDRLILPLPVLRAWFRRAGRYLADRGHPSVMGQVNLVGGEPGQTGAGGNVEIVGGPAAENPRNRLVVSRFDVWTAKVPASFRPTSWDDLAPSGKLMSKIGSDLSWDTAVVKARRFNTSMVEHPVSMTDPPEGEASQVCDKRTTHGVRPWAVVVGSGSGRVGDSFGSNYSQRNETGRPRP